MNTRSSSWTQKAPRNLEEAFGPYCGNQFKEEREFDWQDAVVMGASLVVFFVFVGLLFAGMV